MSFTLGQLDYGLLKGRSVGDAGLEIARRCVGDRRACSERAGMPLNDFIQVHAPRPAVLGATVVTLRSSCCLHRTGSRAAGIIFVL